MDEKEIYEGIFDKFIADHEDVKPGVMMREPALTCKGKVFAFFYGAKNKMCFKLGKGFLIEEYGIEEYEFLSPFKNKPPMYGWFMISEENFEAWEELTHVSLDMMRN